MNRTKGKGLKFIQSRADFWQRRDYVTGQTLRRYFRGKRR